VSDTRVMSSDDEGSSPVEFVLVAALLTALTLGVLQVGLAIYVRNVVHDAAVEGAHVAALADTPLRAGVERTRSLISRAVGSGYATDVTAVVRDAGGHEVVEITVSTYLPLTGLLGIPQAMEVTGRAPVETLQ